MTTKLQGYIDAKSALDNYVSVNGNDMCAEIFEKAFAANPAVNMIIVNGYTPGFNDGDPCTHTQYSFCNGEELQGCILECSQFAEAAAEFLGAPQDDDSYVDPYEFIEEYEFPYMSYQDASKVTNVVDSFQDLLEEIYGTDWQLFIIKKADGTISVEFNDEYDCGY